MFLRDRLLLNAGQAQVAGLWGASSATPPRGWEAKVQTLARRGDPHVPPSLINAALGRAWEWGGQTAALGPERCDFKSRGSRTMCSA